MSESRRSFLKAAAALAAAGNLGAANPPAKEAAVQVPKMKFGNTEISRLVLGTNPFYGYSHYSRNLDHAMREWYTPGRVCEVIRRCAAVGINAFNYVNLGRSASDMQKYYDEGGKMNIVAQCIDDPTPMWNQFRPLAIYNQGEQVDKAWLNGEMDSVKEWCKKARQLGTLVGVGTHQPEVIAFVEEQGWDVDFYAGCVYNRTRTSEEWKQALNGEIQEVPQETYLRGDPAKMYKVMRQTKKPCFAFKVLAAGRIGGNSVEQAFRTAFSSIKPTDGVFVGMWPYAKDEVAENARLVTKILTQKTT